MGQLVLHHSLISKTLEGWASQASHHSLISKTLKGWTSRSCRSGPAALAPYSLTFKTWRGGPVSLAPTFISKTLEGWTSQSCTYLHIQDPWGMDQGMRLPVSLNYQTVCYRNNFPTTISQSLHNLNQLLSPWELFEGPQSWEEDHRWSTVALWHLVWPRLFPDHPFVTYGLKKNECTLIYNNELLYLNTCPRLHLQFCAYCISLPRPNFCQNGPPLCQKWS